MIQSPNVTKFNPDGNNSESLDLSSANSVGKYVGKMPKGLMATKQSSATDADKGGILTRAGNISINEFLIKQK